MSRTVTLRIKRYNPEAGDTKPHFEEHVLDDVLPTDRVLDLLNRAKWEQDGTLVYRRSCAHGICGSDAMVINGKNRLACKILAKDLPDMITIEPLKGLPVQKDLIVDFKPFFESYESVLPYQITEHEPEGATERLQSAEDQALIDDQAKCIMCAICTTSCPSFWANGKYVGPSAIVQASRFLFDTRDEGNDQRLSRLNEYTGVWRCRTIFNCVEACPQDIDIPKHIGNVKKALLYGRTDFLRK